MITKALLAVLSISGCVTDLTDGGRRIAVVEKNDRVLEGCKRLSSIAGKSSMGGKLGHKDARILFRNQAAEVPGADTAVITSKSKGGLVEGFAYQCSKSDAEPEP